MEQVAQDLIDKVEELAKIPANIRDSFNDAAETAIVRYVLRNGDEIIELGNKFADAISELWQKFVDCLKGIAAPGFFIATSYDWTDFAKEANTLASDLEVTSVNVDGYWQGSAATAYGAAITPQRLALARVGSIATAARSAMITVGVAGVTFYTSLLAVAIGVIIEALLEVGAAGTGIGAVPAAVAGLVTAAKTAALLTAAISGIVAIVSSALTQAQALQVELDNPQGFPGGHWPTAGSSNYSDATVKDGDADWSVK
ncbi:hypothetical protein ACFXK0_22040 [Nocardia sp. NPDC059177]|uniref:hypothetical protein n=1 Tax=Nocardia sp. NPDC059177 TaxID=3346759 RepID=UPI003674ACF8